MSSLQTIRETIETAMASGTMLTVSYMARDNTVTDDRVIDPKYFVGDREQSVMIYDVGADGPRNLTLDRILSAEPFAVEDYAATPAAAADLSVEAMFAALGRVEVLAGDEQVTLNWDFRPSGAHMTVTAPTLAAALAAAG
jgi:predicted DNA-binding transcriptional regulator YafY